MGCRVPEAVERPGGPLGIKAVADVVIWEGTLTTKAGVAAPAFVVVVVGHFSLGLFFDPFGLPRFLAPVVVVVVVAAMVVVVGVDVVIAAVIFDTPGDARVVAGMGDRVAAAIASK